MVKQTNILFIFSFSFYNQQLIWYYTYDNYIYEKAKSKKEKKINYF